MNREAPSDVLTIVSERYPIIGELGRGGMSVVYEALDPRINRSVAIKILHPHLAQRADTCQRFLQEAMAIARLENSNILKVYDYASPNGSVSYIVSEIIRGDTLKSWVEEHPIHHWEVAALLALPLFRALSHVHQQEIIHRDVKPENIMIRAESGSPVLMDFGIAHIIDAETLTATGAVLGSPAYMAPEIVNGEELTVGVDIFSMGTVLYWMTCGVLPFVAPNPAALFRRILETRFDPVLTRRPEVLGGFARLIERCMSREPDQRPCDAGMIADYLEELLGYAGLTEIERHLSEIASDPESFQRALPDQLAPRYYESATDAFARDELQLARELVERALYLNPQLEEAQTLKSKIESALRQTLSSGLNPWSRGFFALICVVIIVSAGWAGYTYISISGENAQRGSDREDTSLASSPREDLLTSTERSITERAMRSRPVENPTEAEKPVNGESKSTLSIKPLKRSEAIKAAVASKLKLNVDEKSTRRTGQVSRPERAKRSRDQTRAALKARAQRPLRRAVRRSISPSAQARLKALKRSRLSRSQQGERGASNAQPSGMQRIKISSHYKGVKVFLNGEFKGHVYQIDTSRGLKVPLGKRHELTFKSPVCEERRQTLYFKRELPKAPQVVFECAYLPATLIVRSSIDAELFVEDPRPRLIGRTNQVIRYPLKSTSTRVKLVLVDESTREELRRAVSLKAGHRSELRWR